MRKKNFYFITDKCNASCKYCFVDHHKGFVLSRKEIDSIDAPEDGENIIYGGEPTLYPDIVTYLLDKLNYRNAHIYSNGYNTDFLKSISERVKITINYDAFLNTKGRDKVKEILDYNWVYTIAPSNLKHTVKAYKDFIKNDKYPYFKVMVFKSANEAWNEKNIDGLENCLRKLYNEYVKSLGNSKRNFMPYVLRDTLKRLLAYASGEKILSDCFEENRFLTDGTCRESCADNCNDTSKCNKCIYKWCCQFNIPCLTNNETYLCDVSNTLNKCAFDVFEALKDKSSFQKTLLSIYEDTFYV